MHFNIFGIFEDRIKILAIRRAKKVTKITFPECHLIFICTALNECFEKIHLSTFDDLDRDLFAIGLLDEALVIAVSELVGDPAGSLWVVGLRLQLLLQLRRDNQPWTRIFKK